LALQRQEHRSGPKLLADNLDEGFAGFSDLFSGSVKRFLLLSCPGDPFDGDCQSAVRIARRSSKANKVGTGVEQLAGRANGFRGAIIWIFDQASLTGAKSLDIQSWSSSRSTGRRRPTATSNPSFRPERSCMTSRRACARAAKVSEREVSW
jgi:hypothetical protein